MSKRVIINDNLLEMTLLTRDEVNADAKPIGLLYQSLRDWDGLGAIREITFRPDVTNPALYHYQIENEEGNMIHTTFLMASDKDTNPMLTISIDPAWLMSVVAFGGAVRKQLLEIRALFGIEDFVVVFI